MPPWIVLVDCRASGHIWKSRQYIGNALGSADHVTATYSPRGGTALQVHFKEFVLSKDFFLDGVRGETSSTNKMDVGAAGSDDVPTPRR
jgi:hypothetical protein